MSADLGSLRTILAPDEVSIGFDIGGTKVLGVVYGPEGILASMRRPTVRGTEGLVGGVHDMVDAFIYSEELDGRRIATLGIGLPGLVDAATGSVSHGINIGLPEAHVPFADLVTEATGIPTFIENDVNVAAVGAAYSLGCDDAAMLSLGTGMAVGMVLEGVPRRGAVRAAGEIGHIVYRPDGPLCSCGQRGCLELYASGRALHRLWQPTAGSPYTSPFEARAAGDATAAEALDQWFAAITHAVHTVGMAVDPRILVLGGGVACEGEPFVEGLKDALRTAAAGIPLLERMGMADRLTLVPDGVDAPTLGAAIIAAEGL